MRALTAQELTDILWQKPDRITAGILEKRSVFEKLKDEQLTWKMTSDTRNGSPGALAKLKHKLLLHFEACAKVTPHPRALKKAALELKALGFSNEQIKEIKDACYRFTLTYCEPDAPLKNVFKQDYPGYNYDWCDNAFLGAALVPSYNSFNLNTNIAGEERDKAYKAWLASALNPALTKNSIFTPTREEQAYDLFKKYLPDYIDRWPDGKNLFLAPAHPRKPYKKLCP